jgi:uncharacterized protein (TIGR02001 family)
MKTIARATSLALLAAASGAAFAQAASPEPDYQLTYNVGVVSDYRVRGIAQTAFKPALQAGIDFVHKSGFYAGTFASNVRWIKDFNLATKGAVEVDLYGGYKGAINSDFSYDVGAITYQYPGNNSGDAGTPGAGLFDDASTWEVYGALTYKMFTLKYNRSIGNFLGNLDSSGSQYLDLSANFDLGHGFSLTPHVGHQWIPNQALPASYTDYSLTVAKDMGSGFVLTAAAIGTNASKAFYTDVNGRFLGKSTLEVGVKYTF